MDLQAIMVLAFGRVSLLEICSVFSRKLKSVEMPCERVALIEFSKVEEDVTRLAGIHKLASPVVIAGDTNFTESTKAFLEKTLDYQDDIANFSVSSYCHGASDVGYDDTVATILSGLRESGFRKINLIRPKDRELKADEIVSRGVLDIVEVFHKGNHYLAPTVLVSDYDAFHSRGTGRPFPSSEITLSPRLAKTLLNLTGLSEGETLLDPFCGSGTIISEGALTSLNCIGIDSNPKRVAQARQNLDWLESQSGRALSYRFEVGDARSLEERLTKVDGIATEPILLPRFSSRPSRKKAKDLFNKASRVYSEALYSMAEVLRKGSRVALTVPTLKASDGSEVSMRLEDTSDVGLKEFQPGHARFEYPVKVAFESTRWLGRAIYVFERT